MKLREAETYSQAKTTFYRKGGKPKFITNTFSLRKVTKCVYFLWKETEMKKKVLEKIVNKEIGVFFLMDKSKPAFTIQ